MGKYDFDAKYDKNEKYSLYDLCNELLDELKLSPSTKKKGKNKKTKNTPTTSSSEINLAECEAEDAANTVDPDTLYKKFKSYDKTGIDKSGLLNKLIAHLNFDLEAKAKNSPEENFDMLRVLKLLYKLEKDPNGPSVKIPDILAKTRLANLSDNASHELAYVDELNKLFNQIQSAADDAEERISLLQELDNSWKILTLQPTNYVLSEIALATPEICRLELKRIKASLNDICCKLDEIPREVLDHNSVSNEIPPEGIINSFFNILVCHKILCMNHTLLALNEQLEKPPMPSQNYVCEFRKTEAMPFVSDDLLTRLSKYNPTPPSEEADPSNDDIQKILGLVSYHMDIPEDDLTHYRYAAKHAKTVIKWWNDYYPTPNQDKISVDLLCVVMQEIVYCKKNTPHLINDYYGYTNNPISMLRALSDRENANPLAIRAWVLRLENRLCANLGVLEHLKIKRDIENTLFEIKKRIFSYHHIHDLRQVNTFLTYLINMTMISVFDAVDRETAFFGNFLDLVNRNLDCKLNFTKNEIEAGKPNTLLLFADTLLYPCDLSQITNALMTIFCFNYLQTSDNCFETEFTIVFPEFHPLHPNLLHLTLTTDKTQGSINANCSVLFEKDTAAELKSLSLERFFNGTLPLYNRHLRKSSQ